MLQTIRHERICRSALRTPGKGTPHAFSLPTAPAGHPPGAVALTVALAVLLAAVRNDLSRTPSSISATDFNRDVDYLFKILIYAGTAVFIFVEGILLWTMIKFRKRAGQPEPEHVHGNTTLEIAWTVIPLADPRSFIAIPTVRTIFKTQAKARSDALQVEVIGHQWWWEFRYPQYKRRRRRTSCTCPIGRTVNFSLKSQDVIHSFWIPPLARQARRDPQPHELPLVHAGLGRARTRSTASAPSTAERRTRTCTSRRSR